MSVESAPKSAGIAKKYTAYVCSHTHWDREWYGSFQQFRYRLVRLVDRLMDLLDQDPEFRCFNLDGQTVVLEDYLEVKPEQRARLENFIREGRIAIGPWYMLPDEWLVSGESNVRNLLRGRAICREFGVEGSQVGYLPDMFGHISQIPQILRGFNLDNTIFWRGLSGDEHVSEMWWESPDGSRVFGFHLPEYCGYCNAAFFYHSLPKEARTLGEEMDKRGWEMVNDDVEFAAGALRKVADRAIEKSRSGKLLFMNGVDHMEAQPQIVEIIKRANETLDDVELVHATYEEFMNAVKQDPPADLKVVRGEHRSTAVGKESGAIVLPNILSSRIYLKQSNAMCQALLEKWTEPFASAAAWIGNKYPQGLIHTGWKWLLRNHPHDSIGGCSIDDVHRQMETRFEWAQDIAEILAHGALWQVTEAIDTTALTDKQCAWYLFNPLNWELNDLVVVNVDLDADWLEANGVKIIPENIFGSIRNIQILDWSGAPAEFEILDIHAYTQHRPWRNAFGPLYHTVRLKVALWAEGVPAFGYKGYRIETVAKMRRLPNRHSLSYAAHMENEHLSVEVKPNGTLTITGRAVGGKTLEGLHYFEDGGDNGDGYTYSPPRFDQVVTSLGSAAQIIKIKDEPAVQEIAVDYTLNLPESVTPDRQHRTARTVATKVRSVFRLGGKSKRIDVETTFTNVAKDHRLQICFPVPDANTDTHFTEMQFDIVERKNRIEQPSAEVWIEDMPIEQPQQDFVSYGNLAIANFGLPEYEISAGDPKIIRLTLLRAVNFLGAGGHTNTIVGGAGPHIETPDQQCINRSFTLRYSIVPHSGDVRKSEVQRQAHQHNALWRGSTTRKHVGFLPGDALTFVRVEGDDIVLSSVKQVDFEPGDYVVRFWNSSEKDRKANVAWFKKPSALWRSNLAEDKLEALEIEKETLPISVGKKQIVTLRFTLG